MLGTVYTEILGISKVACLVILAVLIVRLCLIRAPKVFSYALWAIVLFRLLCPVSIEAPVSLIFPEMTEQIDEIADEVFQSAAEYADDAYQASVR